MPRSRPPFLLREVTRHGKVKWYVRVGKGPRIRVADFGTTEFDAEYEAALSGEPKRTKGAPAAGSLTWLVTRYRETNAWTSLSLATRRQRENIFRQVIETAGDQPISKVTPTSLENGRDRRSVHQGRHFLDAMRGLFRWAQRPSWQRIRLSGLRIRSAPKVTASFHGRKKMSRPTKAAGALARGKGFGSTSCFIPDCGAAMRCGSAVSMYRTARQH